MFYFNDFFKNPLQIIGGKQKAIILAWMYMSLPVGIFLLILVNIELILRKFLLIFHSGIKLPEDLDQENLGA